MTTPSWDNYVPPESEIIDGVWYPSDSIGHNLLLVRDIRALVRRMLEPELAEPLIAELDRLYERKRFPLP